MNRTRILTLFVAMAGCGSGCSATGTTARPHGGEDVGCSTTGGAELSKVHHWAAISASPLARYPVAVTLKPTPGACVAGASACSLSEPQMLAVQKTNQNDVECLVNNLKRAGKAPVVAPVWYDIAGVSQSGRPIPLGTSFSFTGTSEEIQRLSASELVVAIDPAPGQGAGITLSASPEPGGCPTEAEDPGPKLTDVATIQGSGRQPVVVQLRDSGVLPAAIECAQAGDCEASVNRLWERTILNTRELTCVRRWIDATLNAIPMPVNYASGSGSASAPPLPPFGQAAGTVSAQGMMLTWEEAALVAEHPYVERIWTSPALQQPVEMPTCPPNPHAVIPEPLCDAVREPSAGKIELRSQSIFEAAMGSSVEVAIKVRGGAEICPLDSCAENSCASAEEVQTFWAQQNLASQKCVRDLIAALGGDADPETFWLVNSLVAKLTWAQIQVVATHPDVSKIDPAE